MTEKRLLDSEYEWIVRACTNVFNIHLTMMHFIFYDNTLSLQPENFGNSKKSAECDSEIANASNLRKISEISLLSYTLFMATLDLFAYCIYQ